MLTSEKPLCSFVQLGGCAIKHNIRCSGKPWPFCRRASRHAFGLPGIAPCWYQSRDRGPCGRRCLEPHASAAIDAIVVVWPESVTDRVSFTLGGLSGVTSQSLALCVPALLVALVCGANYLGRGIDLLALGDEAAHGLGLDVRACRLGTIACAALLAASAALDLRPSQLCGPHRPQPGAHVGAPHNSSGARSLRPVGSCALGCVRPRGADHCVSLRAAGWPGSCASRRRRSSWRSWHGAGASTARTPWRRAVGVRPARLV